MLYTCFGMGAALGAVSVGTVFTHVPKAKLLRPSFIAFAAVLAAFALLRSAALAYPVALLLGYVYFVAITALSTLIQAHLADEERGRVMALWIMGFGGTVPVGVLVGGSVGHATSITAVILAVWGLGTGARPRGRMRSRYEQRERPMSEGHEVAYRETQAPGTRRGETGRRVRGSRVWRPDAEMARARRARAPGGCTQVVNGRLDGLASDAWTQAQVDRRRSASANDFLDEWDECSPKFEALLANGPAEMTGQAVFDAATHELDLLNAVGIIDAAAKLPRSASVGTGSSTPAHAAAGRRSVTSWRRASKSPEPATSSHASRRRVSSSSAPLPAGARRPRSRGYGWDREPDPSLLLAADFFSLPAESIGE